MRSHRLALTTVALGTAAVLATGCGAGRDTPSFGADPAPGPGGTAVQAAPATQAPPVVIAGPDQKVVAERNAAAADAARSREAAAKADEKRKATAKELREERRKAARARKRAAAREAFLRHALAAKDDAAPQSDRGVAEAATPKPRQDAPIGASDTGGAGSDLIAERNRRSDAEARAAVVRFHELLDARDARACDVLTPRLLNEVHGDAPGALDRCRASVQALDKDVSVVIAESRAHGRRSSVAVVSRVGDAEVAQTLRLVLVSGTWLIDAIERKPAR